MQRFLKTRYHKAHLFLIAVCWFCVIAFLVPIEFALYFFALRVNSQLGMIAIVGSVAVIAYASLIGMVTQDSILARQREAKQRLAKLEGK